MMKFGVVIHQYHNHGIETWSLNKSKHREDGPAYIDTLNGFQSWWIHGKRHRVDGPAVINSDGSKHGILMVKNGI